MYLVDTNVISEFRKYPLGKADANVAQWMQTIEKKDIYFSVVSMMEIKKGILLLARKDPNQANIIRNWFHNELLPAFHNQILPISLELAIDCADLHVPDKKSEYDAWIGATAKFHRLTLVTRNVSDFQNMGISVLNPFESL